MKTVKSLLLGSAAGLVAFTGAQAADLPMAEPVEYVRVCDTYGSGYFYIPGTETCLRVSGYVRVEAYVDFNDEPFDGVAGVPAGWDGFAGLETDDNLSWFARGDIRFDARTETEWGTLRSYIEIQANREGSGRYDDDGVALDQAFIQFAGLTIGRAQSFYDFLPYDHYGDLFSDDKIEQIAYTASFGSGFAATIALENKGRRHYLSNLAATDDGVDAQTWPNVVAALRVDQAWGAAQLSVAVQDNEGNFESIGGANAVGDDIGFAVQAGLQFNLPTASDGSFIWVQGAYSEGAIDYVIRNRNTGAMVGQIGAYFNNMTDNDLVGGEYVNNEIWAVGGGVNFQASDAVRLAASAFYWEYEGTDLGVVNDLEGLKLLGGVYWNPVRQLELGAEAGYASVEDVTGFEVDDLTLTLRAQRSF